MHSTLLMHSTSLIHSHHEPAQQSRKHVAYLLASLHHLLVIYLLVPQAGGHVRDTGDSQHRHSHVPRDNSFRHRAHAYGVGAKSTQHMNLSWSLITGPRERSIYTSTQLNTERSSLFNRHLLQLARVNFCHVRKARTKAIVVRATQRAGPH